MGIRESLNQQKSVVSTLLGIVIVALVSFIVWNMTNSGTPTIPGKSFYTIDDGQTWFADGLYKPVPFDHDGKKAYQAHVFRCGEKTVVPFVMRLGGNFLKEAEVLIAKRDPDLGLKMESLQRQGLEVRKVGTDKWLPVDSSGAQNMMASVMKCPDGKTMEPVTP